MFHLLADKLYVHITSYLPWSYRDPENNTDISVIKLPDGSLKVETYDEALELRITVIVPQYEIENMLAR